MHNRDPRSGLAADSRRKDQRRIGYDFNFHVPKSVSVLYGLTRDERMLDAFRDAVDGTMRDIEAEMKTRVRVNGEEREPDNGQYGLGRVHPLHVAAGGGVPDPHLHAHCFVFNTTFDEKRESAGRRASSANSSVTPLF